VVGAGTGGTSATIGRYLRYHRHGTELAGVDPENSAFYPGWRAGVAGFSPRMPSRIEGLGRPRMEPSFVPAVIDHMIQVPDAASVAAMRHLRDLAGLHAGPSTGTNLWGVWQLVAGMVMEGRRGSVVSLMRDAGDRYSGSYYNEEWLQARGLDPRPHETAIKDFFETGTWRG
jgi:cysteine synthase A